MSPHGDSAISKAEHLVEEHGRDDARYETFLRRCRAGRAAPRVRVPRPHHIRVENDAARDGDIGVELEGVLRVSHRVARATGREIFLLQIAWSCGVSVTEFGESEMLSRGRIRNGASKITPSPSDGRVRKHYPRLSLYCVWCVLAFHGIRIAEHLGPSSMRLANLPTYAIIGSLTYEGGNQSNDGHWQ